MGNGLNLRYVEMLAKYGMQFGFLSDSSEVIETIEWWLEGVIRKSA
jgi:hypothetical protein